MSDSANSHDNERERNRLWQIVRLLVEIPLFFLAYYVFTLGLDEFFERHINPEGPSFGVIVVGLVAAFLGTFGYYTTIGIRSFLQGMREANANSRAK